LEAIRHATEAVRAELSFCELTDGNREEVVALRVAPHQEQFVSTVADSLEEAAEHPEARP
jgi:hypothetical protein